MRHPTIDRADLDLTSDITHARTLVTAAGFTLGVSYEDEHGAYAASMETIPDTMGHPRHELRVKNRSILWRTHWDRGATA